MNNDTTNTHSHSLSTVENYLNGVFNFSVNKVQLYDGDMHPTPHFGLQRSDTRESLPNTFKANYTPHTLEHTMQLVRAYHHTVGGIGSVEATWKNGHVIILRPPAGNTVVINGYDLEPTMMIVGGYDATAFIARMGLSNGVCLNGLFNFNMDATLVRRITHSSMLEGRVERLTEDIMALSNTLPTVYSKLEAASEREVILSEFLLSVCPISPDAGKRTRTNHADRMQTIFGRLLDERDARGMEYPRSSDGLIRVNALEAYNAVQGYYQHDAPSRKVLGSTDMMVRAVDNDTVRKAAALAFA